MSKRTAALAIGLCLLWTAGMAVLLWPHSGDRDTAADAGTGPSPGLSAAAGDREAGGGAAPDASDLDAAADALGDAAGEVAGAVEPEAAADPAQAERFAVEEAPSPLPVQVRIKRPPASGLLFDVDSGEVLWARRPAAERPIASLTKMMTALVIAERHRPDERVAIGAKAPRVEGSRIGVLKTGRRVPLGGLFLGLLMASGNDAAVALAEHDAGTVKGFVGRMNARAAELGLECTRFAGPAGLQDTGNASCAYDLAALARADLANGWVAKTIARRSTAVPFPTKGGTLHLANNHYFVQRGIAGLPRARVTGVKTGLTNGAGRCYATTARMAGRHLGVVLLDSPDPIRQVPLLLKAGFDAGGTTSP